MPLNYDAYQQVFGLSLASNAVRTCKDTSEKLQKKLADNLPLLIDKYVGSGWEIVWGPAVWKHKDSKADQPPDNAWFVAKNPSLTFDDNTTSCTYVVAIAATTGQNMKSYDWLYEDFAVGSVVDLPGWISGPGGITTKPDFTKGTSEPQVLVANGTAQAVYTLANSPPSGDGQSSLAKWLKTLQPPADSKIIFTGHSLGGALSPALAITLSEAGYLSQFSAESTLVYPTAGATPGNDRFASLFQQIFPPIGTPGSYKVWNQNFVNSLDIVPHAWCKDKNQDLNLHVLTSIFGTPTTEKLRLQLGWGVRLMLLIANLSRVTYRPINHCLFRGEKPTIAPETLGAYMDDAVEQHMTAYYKAILGTTNVPEPLCPVTPKDRYASLPVLGAVYSHLSGVGEVEEAADT